jgi:hypothetical protein
MKTFNAVLFGLFLSGAALADDCAMTIALDYSDPTEISYKARASAAPAKPTSSTATAPVLAR